MENEPPRKPRDSVRRWPLVLGMLVAIGAVTALAWWDEQREADASLQDLTSEQSVVASLVAAFFTTKRGQEAPHA